jgi:bleomycin hydrolase
VITWRWQFTLAFIAVVALPAFSQMERRDKGVFVTPHNEFMDSLKAEAARFRTAPAVSRKDFRPDFSLVDAPRSIREYTQVWHQPPVSQGLSGMCWCFSTTSFFESEVQRLSGKKVRLSELHTVYWEYVEKARRFLEERGHSAFGEGSEANAVTRIWKKYGVLPLDAYSGKKSGQKVHDHEKMYAEMKAYLDAVERDQAWDVEGALATIRSIMNHYIGEPPTTCVVDGKTMTPKQYLSDVLRLQLDDYVDVMSSMQQPYFSMAELEVPDNWWHSKEYLNVPLDDFMNTVKGAIKAGYSVCIGGDVSEAGYEGHAGVGFVPSFDIPSAFIDENARQFRFSNATTQDDHGIHLVGYAMKNDKEWFLIKDSAAGSRNNTHPGYYFYHEDYVKLKMLSFMVHRSAAEEIMKKLKS